MVLLDLSQLNFSLKKGFDTIGIDNNLREFFFGKDGSTRWIKNRIKKQIAINGGIKKLINLTFLFDPNLNFLGMLAVISVFLILTFGDSFN